jgi:RsmE family RNA methyltransferase
MNCLLLHGIEFDQAGVTAIEGAKARQLIERHKLEANACIKAGVLGGKLGQVTVLELRENYLKLLFRAEKDPPVKRQIIAVVAVSRPQIVKRVVWLAAELGLRELHFIRSANSQKSYFTSKNLSLEVIADELIKALEQAVDTVPPRVAIHPKFKPFIEDYLPELRQRLGGGTQLFVADTRAELGAAPPEIKAPAILAIGPEGGWSDYELQLMQQQGFKGISLGERMLRVDVALAYAVAQICN